jgi:hypothetical protein
MRSKFTTYMLLVTLFCSLGSWWGLARSAMGGRGTGNSWHTSGSPGYSGGGWATGGGGGHK